MSLPPGARLGPYEVVAPLGAGGMGEVHRARDTKLERDVALKVLPEAFTTDPDRLARFQREAKVLASLNHPHIAQIHGLEEADGQKALVLELVEGPTLADRIAQGPIPLDEALPVARQIAEALDAAHEQGIVHRDLKPANVKVKSDGTVKVLDFGLAKAFEAEGEDPDASQSPTLTARATQTGVILGTAAYMSPEQARGKPVDKRADVWAFGVVLYEMLTGRRAFVGEDVSLTLAEVMKSEPDWSRLPSETPRPIRRLVRRCLEKSPERRLRDIGDARLEIEEVLAGEDLPAGPEAGVPSGGSGPRTGTLVLGALGIAVTGIVLGFVLARGGLGGRRDATSQHAPAPTRTVVNLPESTPLALGIEVPLIGFESPVVALSPDGRQLVYVGQVQEGTRLYHRDLTRFEEPRPIPGTEGALFAFFSPDSSELGFLTSDRVRRTALGGGGVRTVCPARTPVWATWIGPTIYFADSQGITLNEVPADGGTATLLYNCFADLGGRGPASAVLPGGRDALVSLWSPYSISAEYAGLHVVSLAGGEARDLKIDGFDVRYLSSGHIVFARGERLLAAPFDLERLELSGDAVPVLEGVAQETLFGHVQAAFSDNGTVAFVSGPDLARGRLAWVDRQGRHGVFDVDDRVYNAFDVAADNRHFALQVADVRDFIRVWDSVEGGRGRDVPGPGSAAQPVWSPDGTALAFGVREQGASAVAVAIHELGKGIAKQVSPPGLWGAPNSWVRSGRISLTADALDAVGVLNVDLPEEPVWTRRGGATEALWGVALSPEGDWVAYGSDSGTDRYQVWLEKIGGSARVQVSTDGGIEPVWCRDCDELFFRQSNRILASRVTLEPDLRISAPRVVFEAPGFVDTLGISYRVSSDGQRLYYVRRSQPPVRDRIHIVHNFFTELERLAPTVK